VKPKPEDMKIGEQLLRNGLVTREQLDHALELQKDLGGRLGKILLKMGVVQEGQLLRHLARQLEVELYDLQSHAVPFKLLSIIPYRVMRERKVVPVSLRDDLLILAMVDPQDCDTIEDVRFETGRKVKAVLASEREIDRVLSELTSPQNESLREAVAGEEQSEDTAAPAAESQPGPQPATAAPLEALMRLPPRIKTDALIDVLLQKGVISKEALEEALRERVREEL
jgi:type IV pilus assembly protein PilB